MDDDFCYSYDDNGNLTSKEARVAPVCVGGGQLTEYQYDPQNQLIEVRVDAAVIANYRYDGLGRRIEKDTGGAITRFVYDAEDIQLEFDGTNALLARYTHGPGIDEPLIMERDLDVSGSFEDSEKFSYQADGLGSVTELTDLNGVVARAYVYDSFGQIVSETGALENPYTYTGREFDAETGLYFYRARYYDAATGRFLAEDSVGFSGGDLNLFAYVGNNPLTFSDPIGLVRVEQAITSSFGILANGIALSIGVSALLVPEPTFATKVGGALLISKASSGLALNFLNLINSFDDCGQASDVPSSLANLAAEAIAPGNKKIRDLSDAADILTDLGLAKSLSVVAASRIGTIIAPKRVPMERAAVPDPSKMGPASQAFIGLDAGRVVSDNIARNTGGQ